MLELAVSGSCLAVDDMSRGKLGAERLVGVSAAD